MNYDKEQSKEQSYDTAKFEITENALKLYRTTEKIQKNIDDTKKALKEGKPVVSIELIHFFIGHRIAFLKSTTHAMEMLNLATILSKTSEFLGQNYDNPYMLLAESLYLTEKNIQETVDDIEKVRKDIKTLENEINKIKKNSSLSFNKIKENSNLSFLDEEENKAVFEEVFKGRMENYKGFFSENQTQRDNAAYLNSVYVSLASEIQKNIEKNSQKISYDSIKKNLQKNKEKEIKEFTEHLKLAGEIYERKTALKEKLNQLEKKNDFNKVRFTQTTRAIKKQKTKQEKQHDELKKWIDNRHPDSTKINNALIEKFDKEEIISHEDNKKDNEIIKGTDEMEKLAALSNDLTVMLQDIINFYQGGQSDRHYFSTRKEDFLINNYVEKEFLKKDYKYKGSIKTEALDYILKLAHGTGQHKSTLNPLMSQVCDLNDPSYLANMKELMKGYIDEILVEDEKHLNQIKKDLKSIIEKADKLDLNDQESIIQLEEQLKSVENAIQNIHSKMIDENDIKKLTALNNALKQSINDYKKVNENFEKLNNIQHKNKEDFTKFLDENNWFGLSKDEINQAMESKDQYVDFLIESVEKLPQKLHDINEELEKLNEQYQSVENESKKTEEILRSKIDTNLKNIDSINVVIKEIEEELDNLEKNKNELENKIAETKEKNKEETKEKAKENIEEKLPFGHHFLKYNEDRSEYEKNTDFKYEGVFSGLRSSFMNMLAYLYWKNNNKETVLEKENQIIKKINKQQTQALQQENTRLAKMENTIKTKEQQLKEKKEKIKIESDLAMEKEQTINTHKSKTEQQKSEIEKKQKEIEIKRNTISKHVQNKDSHIGEIQDKSTQNLIDQLTEVNKTKIEIEEEKKGLEEEFSSTKQKFVKSANFSLRKITDKGKEKRSINNKHSSDVDNQAVNMELDDDGNDNLPT